MSVHFDRALLLFEQSRIELAESELKKELAADPQNATAHALLALCLVNRKQYKEATATARRAIHLQPDLAFAHRTLGYILLQRNRYDQARDAVQETIRLDPYDAQAFAFLASIEFNQGRWAAALEAAEQGLEIDPEDDECSNLRAMALVKLGRKQEAGATIDAALAREPENAHTHANMGWVLLERGDPDQAMRHFREALRLDPELNWARLGIVEAMKARNIIYRWVLGYFLWMSKLSGRTQMILIVGLFFGARILREAARNNPALQPYVWPLLVVYIVFAVMTWVADPLFNLVLRFNRFGRLALSRDQIVASNWIGGCLLTALVCLGLGIAVGSVAIVVAGICSGVLIMTLTAVFNSSAGWPRTVMVAYSIGLVLLAIGGVVAMEIGADNAGAFLTPFFLGSLFSGFVANFMIMAEPKR